MSWSMTRKDFVTLSLRALGGTATVMLVGCPDDDDDLLEEGETTGTTVDATQTGAETTETTVAVTTDPPGTTATDDTGGDGTLDAGTVTGETETEDAFVCSEVDAQVGPPSVGPEHSHVVEIPGADVTAGRETTYILSLDLGHLHEITVTQPMFALLGAGEEVMVETGVDATAHAHTVTLVCR